MTAPALTFCDKKIQVCKIWEPEYIPQLIKVCHEQKIILCDLLLRVGNTQSLVQQMGLASHNFVAERFDKRKVVQETVEIL